METLAKINCCYFSVVLFHMAVFASQQALLRNVPKMSNCLFNLILCLYFGFIRQFCSLTLLKGK